MTAPSPAAAGLPAEDVERVARAIGEAWITSGPRAWEEQSEARRQGARHLAAAALAEMRPAAEAACGHLSPALYVGQGQPFAPLMCELSYGHGGAHEARNGDLPPTRWAAVQPSPADGVDPAEIVRQRELGWPDFHPEDFCHRCGRPNVSSWWVDSPQWNAAVEGENRGVVSILCPSCFTGLWEQATGKTVSWELRIDPRSRDARGPDTARWFTLTLNGQDVTVAEVPELPERGLTSLTYDYRTAIQVRSVDDLDGRVLLHEIFHALLRTDPQQVCPADDPRHEDFVRMLTAGLHDAGGFRRAVRPSPDSEAVAHRHEATRLLIARAEGAAGALNAATHEVDNDDAAELLARHAMQWEREVERYRAALAPVSQDADGGERR